MIFENKILEHESRASEDKFARALRSHIFRRSAATAVGSDLDETNQSKDIRQLLALLLSHRIRQSFEEINVVQRISASHEECPRTSPLEYSHEPLSPNKDEKD